MQAFTGLRLKWTKCTSMHKEERMGLLMPALREMGECCPAAVLTKGMSAMLRHVQL